MAENLVSKFTVNSQGTDIDVKIKDTDARNLIAQEISDRSALIKTDENGNTLITTGEKIVESSHGKETIIDTNSTYVGGANTVNIDGAHTEVYGSTYEKTVKGKSTVHYNGGSEEIHTLPAKITAPDLTLDITNGLTYKNPTKYSDYFRSVVAKDPDNNEYNILVANDSTADLGSPAPYHSFKEFGIDNTGIVDCSDALAGVTDNVALSSGTYLISKNCTISAQIAFAKGAKLKVNTGITVSITGYITAPACEIFIGDGTVRYSGIAIADWYTSLNKAYEGCNNIRLMPHTYNLTGDLVMSRSNSSIIGPSFTTPYTNGAIVNAGTHKIVLGDSSATEINNYARSTNIENFAIISSNWSPIYLDGALQSTISGIFVQSSGGSGIIFNRSVACVLDNCYIQSIQESGDSFFAIQIQNTGTDLQHRNASITISRINASFDGTATHNNSYGLRITSDGQTDNNIISDIYVSQCEFNRFSYGVSIGSSKNKSSINLHLNKVITDQTKKTGFLIINMNSGTIQISDCYAVNAAGSTDPMLTFVNSTAQIYISGLELYSVTEIPGYNLIGLEGSVNLIANGLVLKSIGNGSANDISLLAGNYDVTYFLNDTIKHITSIA